MKINVLARKTYITRTGHDLPVIVWIVQVCYYSHIWSAQGKAVKFRHMQLCSDIDVSLNVD